VKLIYTGSGKYEENGVMNDRENHP